MNKSLLAKLHICLGIISLIFGIITVFTYGIVYIPVDNTVIILILGLFILIHGLKDLSR